MLLIVPADVLYSYLKSDSPRIGRIPIVSLHAFVNKTMHQTPEHLLVCVSSYFLPKRNIRKPICQWLRHVQRVFINLTIIDSAGGPKAQTINFPRPCLASSRLTNLKTVLILGPGL